MTHIPVYPRKRPQQRKLWTLVENNDRPCGILFHYTKVFASRRHAEEHRRDFYPRLEPGTVRPRVVELTTEHLKQIYRGVK